MAKHLIAVCRPTSNGWERVEIGNTLVEIVSTTLADPEVAPFVDDVIHLPIQRFPTSCARNTVVKTCQQRGVDFLLFMDVDGAPLAGSFKAMFNYARQAPEPCVIGVPYIAADGEIQVFKYGTNQPFNKPLDQFGLQRFTRDVAATKKGPERVASIGTHFLLIDMRVFAKLKPPYFSYLYNEDETAVRETEDCYLMRHLFYADVPIYCHWDYPARHYKEMGLEVPLPLSLDAVPKFFLEKLASIKEANSEGTVNGRPHLVHANCPDTVADGAVDVRRR